MLNRTAATLALAATLFSCSSTAPDHAAARDIGHFVDRTLQTFPEVPSLGVAVVAGGRSIYAGAAGYSNLAKRTGATADTGYYIASSTKSFTGLACAILAARGQLDLDSPITRYLPEVKMTPPRDASKITIRQLLTHTAALQNDPIVFRTAYSGEHTNAQLVQLLDSSKPGKEGFHYTNLGYVVASLVIERVTQKTWQQVLEEEIFRPLGMAHTTTYMSIARRGSLATPYDLDRNGAMVVESLMKDDQMMHAAGGILTTPSDMLRWLDANVHDGSVNGRQVIPAAAFQEAHRQQVEAAADRGPFIAHGYGLGWYQAAFNGEPVLFQLGGFEGWRTHVSFMPAKKIGVAVMTNSGGAGTQITNLVAAYIYDRLLGSSNVEAKYARELADLAATSVEQKKRYLAAIDARSRRPWMLQHPNGAYAGRYENAAYGTMVIAQKGDKLVASIGPLTSELEAFTKPESARVELVPGSGDVLQFEFRGGEQPASLQFNGETFARVSEH